MATRSIIFKAIKFMLLPTVVAIVVAIAVIVIKFAPFFLKLIFSIYFNFASFSN